ncbi:hypothetical protein KC330_g1467 [Hortaea werneckii]|nr:hypothetical protein KC330_g1467 [Hortaea werneckii]
MADKDELLELQIKFAEQKTELRVTKELLAQAQNAIVHIAAALSEHQSGNNETSLEMQKERAQMVEKENVELKGIVRYLQTEMAKSSQSTHTEGASKDASRGSSNATLTPNSSTDDSTGSGFNIEGDLLSFHDDDAAAATGRVADATRLNQQLESPEKQTPVSTATNGHNGNADRYEAAPSNENDLNDEASQPFGPDPVFGMPSDRKKISHPDGSTTWMEIYPDPPASRPFDSYWRKPRPGQRDPWPKVNHNEWRQLVNLGIFVQQWGDAQWQEWAHKHRKHSAAEWKQYWEEECKARFEQVSKQREAAGLSVEGTEEVANRACDDAREVSSKEAIAYESRTASQHAKNGGAIRFKPREKHADFETPVGRTSALSVKGEALGVDNNGYEESVEKKCLVEWGSTRQQSISKDNEVLIDIDAEHSPEDESLPASLTRLTIDTIKPLTENPRRSERLIEFRFHDVNKASEDSAPTQAQDLEPASGVKKLADKSLMTTTKIIEETKALVGSKDASPDYVDGEVAHKRTAITSTPEGDKEEEPDKVVVGGVSNNIAKQFTSGPTEKTKEDNLVSIDSFLETPEVAEVSVVEEAPPSGTIAYKCFREGMFGKIAVASTASIQPRQGQASAPNGMVLGHALDHYNIPVSFSRAQALPNAHPDLPDDAKRAIFSQLSTEHRYRTAVISNIPPETALMTVLEKVRGGKVMRSVLMPTNLVKSKPAMDGNVALIVFMDGPNAKAYVDECAEIQGIYFWSEQRNAHVKAKVSLCHTPSNTCPGFLASPRAGFSRIIYLADNGAFSPELVVGAVLKVYNRSQEERRSHGAPLRIGRNKDSNSLIMEWASLRDAYNAKNALDKMQWLVGGFDVGYLPDPCGGSVETLQEVALAKDPATVRSIDCPIMWLPPTSQTACLAEADKAMSAGNPNYVWRAAQDYGHQFAGGIVETVGLLDAELMTEPGPGRGANEFKGRKPFGRWGQRIRWEPLAQRMEAEGSVKGEAMEVDG